ncbi:MAG: hypothetical protein AABX28_02685 [Nanoarchaeota archaeon]
METKHNLNATECLSCGKHIDKDKDFFTFVISGKGENKRIAGFVCEKDYKKIYKRML